MTFPSTAELAPRELADYGFARARDLAFDAVKELWSKRRAEGMKQIDLATKLGRDPGWVSRALRGPGNWTMRTFGELVAAMDGEIEIEIFALEEPPAERPNFDAYAEYLEPTLKSVSEALDARLSEQHQSPNYLRKGDEAQPFFRVGSMAGVARKNYDSGSSILSERNGTDRDRANTAYGPIRR